MLGIGQLPLLIRIPSFFFLLIALWLPFLGIIALVVPVFLPQSWILLYGILLWGIGQWGKVVRGYENPYQGYGVIGSDARRILKAWLIGFTSVFCLFSIEGLWGWLLWQTIPLGSLTLNLGLGVILGGAVALAEELLFRSWLIVEFNVEHSMATAWTGSILLFAVAHFLKPLPEIIKSWPQFPGLLLLGWVLLRAKRAGQNRLAFPLGLHASMVTAITLVNNTGWLVYTGKVPDWITGVGGNPLAGIAGCLCLGILGLVFR
jgi:membrane protease YdiL (CAAX protease family)